MIPGLPLAPLPEDDDFDVNDFPVSNQAPRLCLNNLNPFQIDPIEPFRNDEGVTNMDHAMDEQSTLEDVSRPFSEGEIHQTTAVKTELRDDLSLLNLRPVKRQRLEFDGVLLPSSAEVRRRWASEEVKSAQANPSYEIEAMNRNVESWRNVRSALFQTHYKLTLVASPK